jgi:hypothetical protein
MSIEMKCNCDFCGSILVPNATENGCLGFCKTDSGCGEKKMTTNVYLNTNGPHICRHCADEIVKLRKDV